MILFNRWFVFFGLKQLDKNENVIFIKRIQFVFILMCLNKYNRTKK